jgi:hypothetical protein
MAGQMPPGMELGGGQEGNPEMGMEEEGMQGGLDLETMPDEALMDLLEAVQGELEARDQEDAESQDAEHQHAMGIAENAVAASKSKTASLGTMRVSYGIGRLESNLNKARKMIGQEAVKYPPHGLPIPETVAHHVGKHRDKYLMGAGLVAAGAAGAGLHAAHRAGEKDKEKSASASVAIVRRLCGARPFVKAADAINYIPPRRYGIETDHKPGALEKNSDGVPPHGKAVKKELGGKR